MSTALRSSTELPLWVDAHGDRLNFESKSAAASAPPWTFHSFATKRHDVHAAAPRLIDLDPDGIPLWFVADPTRVGDAHCVRRPLAGVAAAVAAPALAA